MLSGAADYRACWLSALRGLRGHSSFLSCDHPLFVKMSMLDRLTAGLAVGVILDVFAVEVVTVTGVQRPVARLNDRRIMIGARLGAGLIVFQPSLPLPGPAFVIRDRHCQAVSPSFGVVMDQGPVSVTKRDDLGPRSWIGQIAVGDWRPGGAPVARFAFVQALRRGSVIAHQCEKRSVLLPNDAGLDVSPSDERSAGLPRHAPVVGNGHQREREAVRIKRDYQSAVVENERMGAGHPSIRRKSLSAAFLRVLAM